MRVRPKGLSTLDFSSTRHITSGLFELNEVDGALILPERYYSYVGALFCSMAISIDCIYLGNGKKWGNFWDLFNEINFSWVC